MTRLLTLTAASAIAVGLGSVPAAAQDNAGDRVNQVIIFGEDECPQSTDDTITVCARLDESERYRIPPNLRTSTSPQNESWTQRALALEAVGDFGPLSCTPVGAGGDLGCTMEMIEAAYAERANSSDLRFAELIEEERAERLAAIDEDAVIGIGDGKMPPGRLEPVLRVAFAGLVEVEPMPGLRRQVSQVERDQQARRCAGQRCRADFGAIGVDKGDACAGLLRRGRYGQGGDHPCGKQHAPGPTRQRGIRAK